MIKGAISKVVEGNSLMEKEARYAMGEIMGGRATPSQIASFLTALRMKGETVEEITGFAREMLKRVDSFELKEDVLVDTCGTGGDGSNTFNISTTTAFVVAGAGLMVAKHGNRALSSRCGSADVLETLGVKVDLPKEKVRKCLKEVGIGFLFAPIFHRAMRYALAPRQEMGIRTVFNVLGPLTNPLGANVRLIGVYDPSLTETLAMVLKNLGVRGACAVWGQDGLDEISITGRTRIAQLKDGLVDTYYVEPEDFGMKRTSLDRIRGGSRGENALILRKVLEGERGPKRDIVLLNSAACLTAAGLARDFGEGIEIAESSINSGKASEKLESMISFTNS